MACPTLFWSRISIQFFVLIFSMGLMSGCAEIDRLTKPRVDGLQQAHYFDTRTLREGGVGDSYVRSSLPSSDEINLAALQPLLVASIRDKRPDVSVGLNGRFQVTANILANDVTNREDNLDTGIYKWTKRRVKVSYTVIDTSTQEKVWTGIIDTSDETLATYEKKKKKEKSRDKVLNAFVAAINKTEEHPYPSPPVFTDIAQRNFEGFALNLPFEK